MHSETQITNYLCGDSETNSFFCFEIPVMLRTLFIPIPLILKIQYFFPTSTLAAIN